MQAVPDHLRSELNLFAADVLEHPYPSYKLLRDVGPAAYLNRDQVWFLGRFDAVRAALGDWKSFSSGQGVGLNPVINKAWAKALICVDPPAHTAMRKLFTDRLGSAHLKPVEHTIDRRANELADNLAFNEVLRLESPIQHFSRVATRDVKVGESVTISAGARAIVSYAAANRDERQFPDADRFDIMRPNNAGHLAFGAGNHACAGQSLAKLEAHAVFKALARRVRRFELAGPPTRTLYNMTRAFGHVPTRIVAI